MTTLTLYAPNGLPIVAEVWTQEVHQPIRFVPEGTALAAYEIAGRTVNAETWPLDTTSGEWRPTVRDTGSQVHWVDENGQYWSNDEVSWDQPRDA